MRRFRRPTFAVILGWVAAALVATVAGLGGIRLVGESLTGTPGGVLTDEDVQRALAAEQSPAASASGAPPPASPLMSPPARLSGSAAARPTTRPATTDPAADPPPAGGPVAPPTTTGPATHKTAPPAGRPAAAPTATSKMGNAPTRPRTTKPPARGVEATFSTRGGTAIARCTGDQAYLVSWSPRPGYSVDRAKQGPDDEVEVRFEGDDGRSELKISCGDGTPVAETKDD